MVEAFYTPVSNRPPPSFCLSLPAPNTTQKKSREKNESGKNKGTRATLSSLESSRLPLIRHTHTCRGNPAHTYSTARVCINFCAKAKHTQVTGE